MFTSRGKINQTIVTFQICVRVYGLCMLCHCHWTQLSTT